MILPGRKPSDPVAPLFRFATEADAIRLANATEYGLAAYFYSGTSTRLARRRKPSSSEWSASTRA